MNIQIFGKSKCFDTKKAERWFKERRIKFQAIDLKKYGMSRGELSSVKNAVGLDNLIDQSHPDAVLLSYLASMAQEENRRTSTRVVWGQTRQMEQGVVFGRSLLGYDVKNGAMEINPEGAEIVRLIFQKYGVEQIGTSEIARYLNCKGYCTYRGTAKWTSSSIIKILNNEKYVGDLVQKKTFTPDFLTHKKQRNRGQVPFVTIKSHHEPIVSREVWNMVQERLQENNKHNKRRDGHSNRYVFSGKIKCGECGSSFVGRFKYLKDGTKIRRWSCGTATYEGKIGCGIGKLVRDDDAIQMLKTAIRNLPMDKVPIIDHVTALAMEAILSSESGSGDDPQRLGFEIERIQKKKEAVMDSCFSGEITKEDMQSMNRKYDSQMEDLRQRKKEAELRQREKRDSKALCTAIQAEVFGILNGEIESEVFCKTMLDSLTVFKDRRMELRLHLLPQVFLFAG